VRQVREVHRTQEEYNGRDYRDLTGSGSQERQSREASRREAKIGMSGKKTIELKPIRTGKVDPKVFARQAREIADRLKASGRTFSDSTETIRRDRETR